MEAGPRCGMLPHEGCIELEKKKVAASGGGDSKVGSARDLEAGDGGGQGSSSSERIIAVGLQKKRCI